MGRSILAGFPGRAPRRRHAAATVILALACLTVPAAPAAAQAGSAPRTDPALARLAWMVGTWVGEEGGVSMEEHWIPARGNVMLGLHRDVRPSSATFFEYLRIQSTDDGIFYVASPNGVPGTAFRLVEARGQRVVFANPEHDYPQRIIYWREGDTLHARIEGKDRGRERSSQWAWQRVDNPS